MLVIGVWIACPKCGQMRMFGGLIGSHHKRVDLSGETTTAAPRTTRLWGLSRRSTTHPMKSEPLTSLAYTAQPSVVATTNTWWGPGWLPVVSGPRLPVQPHQNRDLGRNEGRKGRRAWTEPLAGRGSLARPPCRWTAAGRTLHPTDHTPTRNTCERPPLRGEIHRYEDLGPYAVNAVRRFTGDRATAGRAIPDSMGAATSTWWPW